MTILFIKYLLLKKNEVFGLSSVLLHHSFFSFDFCGFYDDDFFFYIRVQISNFLSLLSVEDGRRCSAMRDIYSDDSSHGINCGH